MKLFEIKEMAKTKANFEISKEIVKNEGEIIYKNDPFVMMNKENKLVFFVGDVKDLIAMPPYYNHNEVKIRNYDIYLKNNDKVDAGSEKRDQNRKDSIQTLTTKLRDLEHQMEETRRTVERISLEMNDTLNQLEYHLDNLGITNRQNVKIIKGENNDH